MKEAGNQFSSLYITVIPHLLRRYFKLVVLGLDPPQVDCDPTPATTSSRDFFNKSYFGGMGAGTLFEIGLVDWK
jgi:hypothetical protein